jgi:polyribonucleotide nucleotidyltransferase
MVIDVSPDGKVRLSRQALLEGWTADEAREHDNANRSKSRDRSSGGDRRGGDRRGGDSRGGDRRPDRKFSR